WLVLQNEFVAVQDGPEQVLEGSCGVALAPSEDLVGGINFLAGGTAAEGGFKNELNLGGRLEIAGSDLAQEAVWLDLGGILDEVAVEHHQGLWNGAIEGRRFVPFVGAEGDGELLQP